MDTIRTNRCSTRRLPDGGQAAGPSDESEDDPPPTTRHIGPVAHCFPGGRLAPLRPLAARQGGAVLPDPLRQRARMVVHIRRRGAARTGPPGGPRRPSRRHDDERRLPTARILHRLQWEWGPRQRGLHVRADERHDPILDPCGHARHLHVWRSGRDVEHGHVGDEGQQSARGVLPRADRDNVLDGRGISRHLFRRHRPGWRPDPGERLVFLRRRREPGDQVIRRGTDESPDRPVDPQRVQRDGHGDPGGSPGLKGRLAALQFAAVHRQFRAADHPILLPRGGRQPGRPEQPDPSQLVRADELGENGRRLRPEGSGRSLGCGDHHVVDRREAADLPAQRQFSRRHAVRGPCERDVGGRLRSGECAGPRLDVDLLHGNPDRPAPRSVSVSSTDGLVDVTWSPVAWPNLAGYYVYRGNRSTPPFERLTSLPLSPSAPTQYRDTTAKTGQTYYYTVTAVDTTGAESAYGPIYSVTIPPYQTPPLFDPVPWAVAGVTLGVILGALYGMVWRRRPT